MLKEMVRAEPTNTRTADTDYICCLITAFGMNSQCKHLQVIANPIFRL